MRRPGAIAAPLLALWLGCGQAAPARAGIDAAPGTPGGAAAAAEASDAEPTRAKAAKAGPTENKPESEPERKAARRAGGEGAPRSEPKPPYLAMRELEQLQDRIAAGDGAAAAAHAKAINRTALLFAAAKPSVWGDARNARALVLYLFSGGNAEAIGRAVPRSALPKPLQDVFEGALAYGLGDDDRARQALATIDPRSLPTALGAHLALVQAGLVADPAKAIERLDLARLLAPGTLVEEAALRKEVGLIDARTGDLAKYTLLARRYASMFPRSIYLANFRQLIQQAALAVAKVDDGASSAPAAARLALIADALRPRDRRRLLLAVAREALTDGRMAMAAAAAEQALGVDGKGDGAGDGKIEADRARARLYFGAAAIAGPQHEAARAALTAAAGGLSGSDEALRLAALSVVDTIHDPAFAAPPSRGGAEAAVIRDAERAVAGAEAAMELAAR